MLKRVAAVIIKNGKILLIRRVKDGREFFVLPRGKVRIKESFESAVKRVIKDEFDIEIEIETFLFRLENKGGTEFYFLVKNFKGEPKIKSERKQILNDNNQYHLEWRNLNKLKKLSSSFPQEAKQKVESLAG